jgi:hypothetical protein
MATRHQRNQSISAYVLARKQADRVLDRTALTPVMEEYDRQVGEAVVGLGRTFRGQTRELVSGGTLTQAMEWLRNWYDRFVAPFEGGMALRVATQHLQMLGELREQSLRGVGTGVVERIMQQFEKTIVDPTIRVSDLISQTGEILDDSGWKVDRMVRTETSYAYNLAQHEAISRVGSIPGFGQVWGRWTERVDDVTGAPYDNRVANDSLALHGQLAKPGALFVMPASPLVKADMIGKGWHHPPNRPNDRAVLTPWMRDWGVQGWMIQNGTRIAF